ncbi:MAG: DUF6142 family protein [Mobilitalea sp.]
MIVKRNKDMIRFSGRNHTVAGICSTIIGAASVLGFVVISFISGFARGKGSIFLGVIGFLLFALAISGFVMACKSFRKKDIFYRYSIIGVALNGIMIILMFVIYLIGLIG